MCLYGNDYFPDARLLQFQLEVFSAFYGAFTSSIQKPVVLHHPHSQTVKDFNSIYVNFHLSKTWGSSFNLQYEKKPHQPSSLNTMFTCLILSVWPISLPQEENTMQSRSACRTVEEGEHAAALHLM